jgi:alpha-1,3-rhamnosyl/mannosyltransferase
MQIAFNTSSLKEPLTGLGQYTLNLAHSLCQLPECQLEFFDGDSWTNKIFIKSKPNTAKYRDLVRDYIPFAYPLKYAYSQYKFSSGSDKKIDLYHEPNYLAFKSEIPTVITVHDVSWITYPDLHPVSRVREMNRYFKACLRQAQHIITDSEFVKKEFIKYFAYQKNKVTAIPLGVDGSFRPRSLEETRNTLNKYALTYTKYFLLLGTLEPRKNLIVVINAFLQLPKSYRQDNPLVIVGAKGWLDGDIRKTIFPLVQFGEVRVLGYLPQIELPDILAGANALLFPSIYEGFGLPPLEAMACGTPVIASNSSSIPEVVGNCGILLDAQDTEGFIQAMKNVIENSELRNTLSIKALERSKQFTWHKCAQDTFKIYQQILGN